MRSVHIGRDVCDGPGVGEVWRVDGRDLSAERAWRVDRDVRGIWRVDLGVLCAGRGHGRCFQLCLCTWRWLAKVIRR